MNTKCQYLGLLVAVCLLGVEMDAACQGWLAHMIWLDPGWGWLHIDLSWQSRVLGLHLHPCSTKGQAGEAFPSEQISQLGLNWRECLCLGIHINVASAFSMVICWLVIFCCLHVASCYLCLLDKLQAYLTNYKPTEWGQVHWTSCRLFGAYWGLLNDW